MKQQQEGGSIMIRSCPLCGGQNCKNVGDSGNNSIRYDCQKYNRTVLLGSTMEVPSDENQKKLLNLVFEYAIRKPICDNRKFWFFYNADSYRTSENDEPHRVNIGEVVYPQPISEKIDRVLLNLYNIDRNYGYVFTYTPTLARAFFADTDLEEHNFGLANLMIEIGYLSSSEHGTCYISAKGWKRIELLQRQNYSQRQGFIAMAFRDETNAIRKAFQDAIKECKYAPLAIDEKEHNNQIVPEIFYEIDNSRFLVMDVTYPNYGAYYEAGYALGKGKQVIICCRKTEFDGVQRPHFDIQQKSTVVWETEAELVEKLIKRIKATVK